MTVRDHAADTEFGDASFERRGSAARRADTDSTPVLPTVSVVIATRDRDELLRRVTVSVIDQLAAGDELIVVDDSPRAASSYDWLGPPGRRVLRSYGRGPAVARNQGWRAASGDVIAFTDDDVIVSDGWLRAIRAEFAGDETLTALEGWTITRPFDPLFEYSVGSDRARNGLTCNAAYRRAALERLNGFDEGFPFAHCEDLDLFTRAAKSGKVTFSRAVQVEHEPRSLVPAVFARRGGWIRSECRLYVKHPEIRPYPLSPVACAVIDYIRWPLDTMIRRPGIRRLRERDRLRRAAVILLLWWWHLMRALPSLLPSSNDLAR